MDSCMNFCANQQEHGKRAVPGSSFFREPVNHLIRLHFARNDETLLSALNRLERIGTLKKQGRQNCYLT